MNRENELKSIQSEGEIPRPDEGKKQFIRIVRDAASARQEQTVREQKVDIYFNFIGCFVTPKPEVILTAEE